MDRGHIQISLDDSERCSGVPSKMVWVHAAVRPYSDEFEWYPDDIMPILEGLRYAAQ